MFPRIKTDVTSGALAPVKGSPFAAGIEPNSVAVAPDGKFAYVPNIDTANVSAYAIDATSGALTPVKGSPFAAGSYPCCVAVAPNGKFAYVSQRRIKQCFRLPDQRDERRPDAGGRLAL